MASLDSDAVKRRRQMEARARLREETARLSQEAPGSKSFRSCPTTKDLMGSDEERQLQDSPSDEHSASDARSADSGKRNSSPDPAEPSGRREPPSEDGSTKRTKRSRVNKRKTGTQEDPKNQDSEESSEKPKTPSGLSIRFRSGLVYTLITVVCVLASNITTVLMLMVTAGICASEFYKMLRSDANLPNEVIGIIAAALYPLAVYFYGAMGAVLLSIALLFVLLIWYVFWLRSRIPDVGVSFFGAAYTGLLLCGLVIIRMSVDNIWGGVLVVLLFLSVWINDAFAYLVGSRLGKHKLAPRTSPNKSWEGFAAGLVGSVIFWIAMSFVPGVALSIPMAIIFGLICGVMEVLGDLAESRIKRNTGFKDSGTIMPGHGGLLDRSDSMLFASITACFLLVIGGCIPFVF